MAYEIKYELFFSDVENNKFKIEILEKDFVLDPFGLGNTPAKLIGTGRPAIIEWDADDDIYSPIIGSRCRLNFFATDANTYDEFYKSGERQYKVKILEYTSFGSDYNDEELPWNLIDKEWEGKLGSDVFYNAIWEGYIVNDGYQEAVITAPYEIKLEAIDGLGTLKSYDVPYLTDNTNPKEKMFVYLKEILKLTGHSFPIYIANDIRKNGGSANDTIFHDIEINRYAFSNKNLVLIDAKEALKYILKMTNSRIFQSFAKWYVVSNSNLIDNRIVQGTVSPSGEDVIDEPDEIVAPPVYGSPDVSIDGAAVMYHNIDQNYRLLAIENGGTKVVEWRWYLNGSQVLVQSDPDNSSFGVLSLGQVVSGQDGESYTVQGKDSNGQTDLSSAFVLDVREYTAPITKADVAIVPPDDDTANEIVTVDDYPTAYDLRVNAGANFNVKNAFVSPDTGILAYGAGESGDPFTMQFNVFSNVGEFTSASQLTSLSITGGFNLSHSLQGDYIQVTVTGNRPIGSETHYLSLKGAADVQQFTHSYTVSDIASNASVSPSTFSASGGDGSSYTKTFNINALSGYKWQSVGNVTVIANSSPYDSLTVSKTNDTTLLVTITGSIGVSDESCTITVSGQPVGSGPATSLSFNPSAPYDIAESSGYFDLKVTSDGNFTATANRPWIHLNKTGGATGTTTIRVKFDTNTGARNRKGSVSFYPTGSSSAITSILLNQDGIG